MRNLFLLFQTDTLTQAYGGKWAGADESTNTFIRFMDSHDLMFVVLGVSLLIWFTLLAYLYRVDARLRKLEQSDSQNP